MISSRSAVVITSPLSVIITPFLKVDALCYTFAIFLRSVETQGPAAARLQSDLQDKSPGLLLLTPPPTLLTLETFQISPSILALSPKPEATFQARTSPEVGPLTDATAGPGCHLVVWKTSRLDLLCFQV